MIVYWGEDYERSYCRFVPCYKESRTIEKVVRDFRRVLPERSFMYMIIIQATEQVTLLRAQGRSFARNACREKGTSFVECFEKLMQTVT